MKTIAIFLLLVASSVFADEVNVALSVNHIWGDTWVDEHGEKHEYNEENKFVSYWNNEGFGAGAFVNSYGKFSVLLGRKGEKPVSCKAISWTGLQCSWGLLFGLASGYEDFVSSGILPVLTPFFAVRKEGVVVSVGVYSASAVITTAGFKF